MIVLNSVRYCVVAALYKTEYNFTQLSSRHLRKCVMSLSKIVKYYCLESSHYFAHDIFNIKQAVHDAIKERPKYGEFHTIYEEIRLCPSEFFEYTRMSVETFDYILHRVRHELKSSVNNRRSISPAEKLFLTLRFLSTGLTFRALRLAYRLGQSTIGNCIYQTCKAIWTTLREDHMPQPTREQLTYISQQMFSKWQFPNCVGVVGRRYYRFRKCKIIKNKHLKTNYVLVLQTVVDHDYKFISTVVLAKDKNGDGETILCSKLFKSMARFPMPPPQALPGSNIILPHVILGDEAYPLKTYLMRPYPSKTIIEDDQKLFNEKIATSRTPLQIAYQIMTNKWKIFQKPLETNYIHTKLLIKIACLLHNVIRDRDGIHDSDYSNVDVSGSDVSKLVRSKRNNRATFQATQIRDQFKLYFHQNLQQLLIIT